MKVIKRDGRRLEFNPRKIYLAVYKACEAIDYVPEESDKVAHSVMQRAAKAIEDKCEQENRKSIRVEEIQDIIVSMLIRMRNVEVSECYITYREKRNQERNRKTALNQTIEEITYAGSKDSDIKRDNGNINGDSAMGMMLQYGSAATKDFTDNNLLSEKVKKAVVNGDIYIHDKDFYPMGTLTCCQIPLDKLFKDGFDTGHGAIREPQNIQTYAALAAIAIQSNQNDHHGGQAIPLFDFYLAPGVTKSLKKNFKQTAQIYLEAQNKTSSIISSFLTFLNSLSLEEWKIANKEALLRKMKDWMIEHNLNTNTQETLTSIYDKSLHLTDKQIYQAMEGFVHNLNTMHCLPYSEEIWVYDKKEEDLFLIPIGRLAEIFETERYYAISLNRETFEAELKLITHALKKDNHRKLITIINKAGQKVTTTDNHQILSFNTDSLNIFDKYPTEIENVISPRNWNQIKTKNMISLKKYETTKRSVTKNTVYKEDNILIDSSFAELFGYYVADGSITSKGTTIDLSICEKVDKNHIFDLVHKIFGNNVSITVTHYKKTNGEKSLKSIRICLGVRLCRMIKDKFGDKSQNKHIPTEILFSPKEIQLSFLNAYLKCDGAHKEYYAEINCTSKLLVSQIHLMCLNMGEFPTIREYSNNIKTGYITNSTFYNLILSGLSCKRMGVLLERYPTIEYPKYDLSFLRDKIQHKSIRRRSGGIRYNELLEKTPISNIFVSSIIDKQELNSNDEYVYDLSVQDNENFLTKDCIFVHNSRAGAQVPFSSINFGMDTSEEGRMVSKNLMLAQEAGMGNGETPIFPILIFQVKEGVNYNPEDPNYDLFKLSLRVSAKRLFPNYVFVDAPFNLQYYDPKDPETIIATMGCRTRVIGNVNGKQTPVGRGNLSFTTINLPRLGIKHGVIYRNENGLKSLDNEPLVFDGKGFLEDFDAQIDLCIEQILERYQVQRHKYVKNFPFLMGQHIWRGSENLFENDELGDVIDQGTLSIGFIGLAECLVALTGHHHGEIPVSNNLSAKENMKDFSFSNNSSAFSNNLSVCENAEKVNELGYAIIYHLRQRMEEATKKYHLNFSVLATPAEGLSGRFTKIDKKKYGIIPGVTDRDYYTNSFHVPVYYEIGFEKKIQIEAPYHELTNAGHITYVEVDGDLCENLDAFEAIIRCMKENGIGYGSVNHPVDRDPVCGYSGVIEGNICPNCGRDISEHTDMEEDIPCLE